MSSLDLDKLVLRLAEEFKRRDMRAHLDLLREYYRGFRARKRASLREKKPPWTEEMVLDWLCVLEVPPFEGVLPVLGRGARPCPCDGKEAGVPRVAGVFPGGCVRQCGKCGERWLEREGG